MKNILREPGLWLGLGPALLVLYGIKDNAYLSAHIPHPVWSWILGFGIGLSVLGIGIATLGSIWDAGHPVVQFLSSVGVRRRSTRLWSRPALHSDLPALYEFFKEEFDNAPSVERMSSWQDRCNTGFCLFFSTTSVKSIEL
jgi:hypothetical protein